MENVTANGAYDGIIVAVGHSDYINLKTEFFVKLSNTDPILFDLKGIYRERIKGKELVYWSL